MGKILVITIIIITVFLSNINLFAGGSGYSLTDGIKVYRSEEFEEALQIFKSLYNKNPDSSLVNFYLGLCYKQVGEYEKAEFYLTQATRLKPVVEDAFLELANLFYQMGMFKKALKWIEKAEKKKIYPARVNFLKGLIFLKLEKYKKAREFFKRSQNIDPSFKFNSQLHIGISYMMEGKMFTALKIFKGILRKNPPQGIKETVNIYINDIERWKKNYRSITGMLTVGYEFDDNVVSKPSSDIGLTAVDDIGRKSDSCITAGASLRYQPITEPPFFFSTEASLNTRTYFHREEYSVVGGVIRISPGYVLSKKTSFALNTEYTHIWFDDAPYLWQLNLNPTFTLKALPDHIFQIAPGYIHRDLLRYVQGAAREEDRDGKQYYLSVGYFHPYIFLKRKGSFNIRIKIFKDNTQGSNWDSRGQGTTMSLVIPITKQLSSVLYGDVTIRRFENINTFTGRNIPGFPDRPTARKDKIYTFSPGINWRLRKHITAYISYTYIRNDSNFKIYDYKRSIFSTGIRYLF